MIKKIRNSREISPFKTSHLNFKCRIDVSSMRRLSRAKNEIHRARISKKPSNTLQKTSPTAEFMVTAPKFRCRYSCRFADGKYARICRVCCVCVRSAFILLRITHQVPRNPLSELSALVLPSLALLSLLLFSRRYPSISRAN